MLPILKRDSSGPTVADLQEALNRSAQVRNDSKLKRLDPDGDFGPLTEARVKEFQTPRALVPDGQVGPLTRSALFEDGYTIISGAQQIAIGWVLLARGAAANLLAEAQRIQGGGAPQRNGGNRVQRLALKTHFHLDLDTLQRAAAGQLVAFLTRISTTYDRILQLVTSASVEKEALFSRAGPNETLDQFGAAVFSSELNGYVTEERDFVRFTVRFTEDDGVIKRGPIKEKRVNTLIHECAHFVDREIHDFAFEFPAPGRPGPSGVGRNYPDLNPDEAVNNAASYAQFAQNVVLGVDHRAPSEGLLLTRD